MNTWLPIIDLSISGSYLLFILIASTGSCKTLGYCGGNNREPMASESTCTSLALVPDSQSLVQDDTPAPFRARKKRIEIEDQIIVIKQKWRELGVAAVVWESAIVLSRYLAQWSDLIRNKRVIELGAGTGLVGMAASLYGADVTITDRPIALDIIKDNIQANIARHEDMAAIKVQKLTWGQHLDQYMGTYDVVLGADIVYLEETFQDLLKTLKHLSNCNTTILLSSKIRYDRDIYFYDLLRKYFEVEEVYYDETSDIHVYRAQRKCQEQS